MKIITNEWLESTGYRCLFECMKQEGIEPVFKLVQDIKCIPDKQFLISQGILKGINYLLSLVKRNRNIIKYLREHEEELKTLKFCNLDFYNTIENLSKNPDLLDLYLNNARRLEELKVEEIEFVYSFNHFIAKEDQYYCYIIPRNEKELNFISKCYTDGKILPRLTEEQAYNFKWCQEKAQNIPFSIKNEAGYKCSFVLETANASDFSQRRKIVIVDFGFDGDKLPTEEEVQSYEIPKSLIKSNRNES